VTVDCPVGQSQLLRGLPGRDVKVEIVEDGEFFPYFPQTVFMFAMPALYVLVSQSVKTGTIAENASSTPDKLGNHASRYHAYIFGSKVNQSPKPFINLLDRLKQKYKLCVITNLSNTLDDLDKKFNFTKKFEFVLDSYHVGARKPDKLFWNILTDRTKCLPKETIVIDDSKNVVNRARNLGFGAIHYKTIETFKEDLKTFRLIEDIRSPSPYFIESSPV